MEAKVGEVRRLHIIYFLSHMGRVEHPHLIRVHQIARNGVYLRDVKRWLGELRGKELPEAFAWSYKRRYKNGCVWQDLLDDELITPISDNEYVLKGSQIHQTQIETHSLDAKKASILAEDKPTEVQVVDDKQQQQPSLREEPQIGKHPHLKRNSLTHISSEISQESLVFSSDRSTLTEEYDSPKVEDQPLGPGKQNPDELSNEKMENCSLPSLYHILSNKKSMTQSKTEDMSKTTASESSFSTSSSSSPSSQSSFRKSKSYSTAAASVFRNLMTCGAVDTNDAVLVMMNRTDKNASHKSNEEFNNEAKICKVDKLGGSSRSFGTTWNQQQQQHGARKSCDGEIGNNRNKKKQGEFMNQTHYKPFGGPICSQCGKSFKPEKMHKHMKSCKGMKALAKSATTPAENTLQRSSTSSNTDSTCNYLLTN